MPLRSGSNVRVLDGDRNAAHPPIHAADVEPAGVGDFIAAADRQILLAIVVERSEIQIQLRIRADLELVDVGLVGLRVAARVANRVRHARRPARAEAFLQREVHAVELRAAVVDAFVHGVAERADTQAGCAMPFEIGVGDGAGARRVDARSRIQVVGDQLILVPAVHVVDRARP